MVPLKRDSNFNEPPVCMPAAVLLCMLQLQPRSTIRFPPFVGGPLKLTYSGLETVFTLWALSTVDKGGLNWSGVDIGQV